MAKRRIRINLEDLEMAFDFDHLEAEHYLDLETGEVLLVPSRGVDEEAEELRERVEDSDRYAFVPHLEPGEGWRTMLDFIGTVKDSHLRQLLLAASDGKGAFRRFKDVLARHPEEQKRWFQFESDRIRERVVEWLEHLGVEWEEARRPTEP
jgi:hypothetical protein